MESRTPYVAFCDDETWWQPGSLRAAVEVLDAHPRLAVVNARIVAEPGGGDDPIVAELRDSPVPAPPWLPGPALGSFLAGASVVRREAFVRCGGFNDRLWLGGEEELLARGSWPTGDPARRPSRRGWPYSTKPSGDPSRVGTVPDPAGPSS